MSWRPWPYINSSNTGSVYEDLAKAVCGDEVQLFTGEAVYRAMARVERLVPTNVGLLDTRNRSRRFSAAGRAGQRDTGLDIVSRRVVGWAIERDVR